MEFNTQEFLKYHFPELFNVISERRINWVKLNARYKARFEKLNKEFEDKGGARYEASIFEILMYSSKGVKQADYVKVFTSTIVHKLKTLLNVEELRLIGDNIVHVITNLDMRYLNFLGELAFLISVKEQKKWLLTGTELKNDVNKRIDFAFKTEEGEILKFEVLNIHLTKEINEKDDGIKTFLSKRINDKVSDKTKENRTKVDFHIVPIIWGPHKELVKISNYLEESEWELPISLKPYAFINFTDSKGEIIQIFQ